MQEVDWKKILSELAEPFPESEIFWRAGTTTRDAKKAMALIYAEPRAYEDRLNNVVGGDWSVSFQGWSDTRIICNLTIYNSTRASTGEENEGFAPGTAAEAQAFKRACSKFGLGRYLYDVPTTWVDYDAERSKLLETPKLAAKFLPKPKTGTATRTTTNQAQNKAEFLSDERASAMASTLDKLGYTPSEQLKLTASVIGRSVKALTEITDAEALSVWTEAKKQPQI